MHDDALNLTFAALADPTRRGILARLAEGEATVNQLAEPFDLKLPTVSKHLKVLQRAGLVTQGRKAQWRPCRIETAPLKDVADWVERYRRMWDARYEQLDAYLAELQQQEKETIVNATRSPEPVTRQVGAMTLTLKSDLEIELSRVFNAPRRLVFEAHSKPEHVTRWWGPRGSTLISCEMDFRPGGTWRYVVREADGNDYAFFGEYREIVPPERLAYTFALEGMPNATSMETMTFTEQDGRTTITSVSVFSSKEGRDAMIASGMETGAAESWDRLDELLEELR